MKIALEIRNALAILLAPTPILSIVEMIFMMHQQPVSSHAQVDHRQSVLLVWLAFPILLVMLILHLRQQQKTILHPQRSQN